MDQQKLKTILELHRKWVMGEEGCKARVSQLLGNRYIVSENGNVFSVFNQGKLRPYPFKLKLRTSKKGYINICFDRKNILVHRVIAQEFIGDVAGKIVHHKNFIRDDNRVSNLEITDVSGNNKHSALNRRMSIDRKYKLVSSVEFPGAFAEVKHDRG